MVHSDLKKKTTIQDIISEVSIVELVKKYIKLHKKNDLWWSVCPFHKEKTGSFVVNENKNFFYCFGCGISGNIFNFLMNFNNIPFKDALNIICENYNFKNLVIANFSTNDHIYKLNDTIRKLSHEIFMNSEEPKNYLKQRNITLQIAEKFGLGFDNGTLLNKIIESDFFLNDLYEIGVVSKSNFAETKFIDRIIFPLFDTQKHIVGFSSRSIKEGVIPKYLHSIENSTFHKKTTLFNINNCLKSNHIYVVEGFFDVLKMYQCGYESTIACLGCELSKEQIFFLTQTFSSITLMFDGDNSGQNGMIKTCLNLLQYLNKTNVDIIILPEDKDPDSFLENGNLNDLEKIDIEEFLWKKYINKNTIKNVHNEVITKNKIHDTIETISNYSVKKSVQYYWNKRFAEYFRTQNNVLNTKSRISNSNKIVSFKYNKEVIFCAYLLFNIRQSIDYIDEISNILFQNNICQMFHSILVECVYGNTNSQDIESAVMEKIPKDMYEFFTKQELLFLIQGEKRTIMEIIKEENFIK